MYQYHSSYSNGDTNSYGTTTAPEDSYKTTYQNAFVKSCVKKAGVAGTTVCTCIADYLVNHYACKPSSANQ